MISEESCDTELHQKQYNCNVNQINAALGVFQTNKINLTRLKLLNGIIYKINL